MPSDEPLSFPLLAAALFLGMCCLFPYNSFLSSPTYLEHYYQYAAVKDTNDVSTLPKADNTSFWDNVNNWATVMMLVPMALAQVGMMTPFMIRLNVQIRISLGALILMFAMFLMPICACNGGVSQNGSIAVVLIACILTGGATSLIQSSSYAAFGTLPSLYVTTFVLGGGVSGSVNSILRLIIHYAAPNTFKGIKNGAVAFYAINMGLMAGTILVVFLLRYNAVLNNHMKSYSLDTGVLTDPEMIKAKWAQEAKEAAEKEKEEKEEKTSPSAEPVEDEETKEIEESPEGEVKGEDEDKRNVLEIAKLIWLMMVCVYFCMFTSLTYFPGVGLAAMHVDKSKATHVDDDADSAHWEPESVTPILIILMYNGGDTLGRSIAMFPQTWLPKIFLVFIVIFRIVACMIPLILGNVSSKVINSNANPLIVFAFLGITNGYLCGTTFAYGCGDPRLLTENDHVTAGTCMAFALLIGCSCGSILALIVVIWCLP